MQFRPVVSAIFFKIALKNMWLLIGERAKRARHSQVCSIENRGYIIIGRAKRAPHWGVQSRFRVIYVGMSDVVQKSVGGITWAKRAHAQSQYCAVKSYQ